MLKRFIKYIDKKRLILNAEKSKVFEKGRGRTKKREAVRRRNRKGKKNEFSKLHYVKEWQRNGERCNRKTEKTDYKKQTRIIGEKIFADDYERRVRIFNALRSMVLYGTKIRRWEKRWKRGWIK